MKAQSVHLIVYTVISRAFADVAVPLLSRMNAMQSLSFPYDYFKDLNLIKKLGIKKVEWLVDKPRIDNPIFDLEIVVIVDIVQSLISFLQINKF